MPQSSTPQEQLDAVAQAVDRASTADAATLAELKTEILGRKAGALTLILRSLAGLPSEERRAIGARANQLKKQLEEAIAVRERALDDAARAPKQLDWTMPGGHRSSSIGPCPAAPRGTVRCTP
jgi:phenylalanyl-tRNA synthetase alpha chain